MIIGIPREIKEEELRVAITSAGVSAFVAHGHKVLIEKGAVPRTSTYALTNSTLSYALAVADQGLEMSMGSNKALKKGLNIYKGRVTLRAVAESFGLDYEEAQF